MAQLFPDVADGETDKHALPGATLEDLDIPKVDGHIARAREVGRLQGGPDDAVAFLRRNRCLVEENGVLIPTVAGVLMFGKDPQALLPHAVVGLAHFPGINPDTTDVLHMGRYGGTLPEQIDAVFRYLWGNIRQSFRIGANPQRDERPAYPRVALRELTINAIVHRDYNDDGYYTRISMFIERIEWISPGGLPAGITVENILQAQFARNAAVAELLYQAGYIERFGLGLDLVMRELRTAGLPALGMRDSERAFTVSLFGNDAPAIRAQTPFRQLLLSHARQHGRLTVLDARRLNDDLGEYRSERSLHYDLRSLVEAGFLRKVGQSRDTTYIPVYDEAKLGE